MNCIPVLQISSDANFNEQGYLNANPDVHNAVKMGNTTARSHFDQFGRFEHRKQRIADAQLNDFRREKYNHFSEILNFKYRYLKEKSAFPIATAVTPFDVNTYKTESANASHPAFLKLLESNPEGKYLDVGAGMRDFYYKNCLYLEVYQSLTTDVVIEADCTLPFDDNQFDGVGCFAVLEHVRHPEKLFNEIVRVTKSKGDIIIDWPFLQPIHGYPSHYFNITPVGLKTLALEQLHDVEVKVEGHQTAGHTLYWLLSWFRDDLSVSMREKFNDLTVKNLINEYSQNGLSNYVKDLSSELTFALACGSTLYAKK